MTDNVTPERDTGRIEAIRWAVTSEKGGWMSEPQAKADVRYILAEYDSLAAQLEAAQKAIAQLEADVEHRDEIIQRFLAAAGERYFAEVELMKLVKDANDGTWDLVSRLAARLPVSVLHSLRETLETRGDIDSPAGYVVSSLKAELEQRKVSA